MLPANDISDADLIAFIRKRAGDNVFIQPISVFIMPPAGSGNTWVKTVDLTNNTVSAAQDTGVPIGQTAEYQDDAQ